MSIHSLAIYLVSSPSDTKKNVLLLASRTNPRVPLQSWWESSSRVLVESVAARGQMERSEGRDCSIFAYNRETKDPLVGVTIADLSYPMERARTLLSALLEEFAANVPSNFFAHPSYISFPPLASYIAKYDGPEGHHDSPDDLAENGMPDMISAAQERGEKLDELTCQSDRISEAARKFYEAARETSRDQRKPRCIIA